MNHNQSVIAHKQFHQRPNSALGHHGIGAAEEGTPRATKLARGTNTPSACYRAVRGGAMQLRERARLCSAPRALQALPSGGWLRHVPVEQPVQGVPVARPRAPRTLPRRTMTLGHVLQGANGARSANSHIPTAKLIFRCLSRSCMGMLAPLWSHGKDSL